MTVLVEDDPSIRKLVEYALSSNSIPVVSFASGEDAFASLPDKVDLFLLDIMLPGMDGIEILHRIRKDEKLRNTPVIMLTAKDSEYDIAKGLDEGADDYISKPFGILELISRVKAAIRRSGISYEREKNENLESAGIKLDLSSHKLFIDGKEVVLTSKEVALSRDKLLTEVWGYSYVGETRTVDVHVRHLREKLGECGKAIETVKGLGYRFDGE